jgi:tetratricopeptide (TPR) repeat protein
LGISHRLNGSYAKALECIELVEDSTDVDALEKQDPSLYVYVRVYEGDFYIAAGRFLDAEKCLKDAERVTAQPWANVSMARKAQLNLEFSYLYYNTGEYEKSEKYGREALRLEIDVYGDKSVESCNGLNQIGWCLLRQGRLEDAYTCFRESYDIRLRLYTEKNPFTLVSLRNCAITHKEMGGEWLAEAKVEFERVLALRQELCKQDAQAPVAGAHLDLCSVLLAMNLPTEALEHAKRAEEIFRLSVGDKDNNQRSYALCYASIGESLLAMDAPSDALPWLREAVSLYEEAYGSDSSHNNLLHARQLLSEAIR